MVLISVNRIHPYLKGGFIMDIHAECIIMVDLCVSVWVFVCDNVCVFCMCSLYNVCAHMMGNFGEGAAYTPMMLNIQIAQLKFCQYYLRGVCFNSHQSLPLYNEIVM